jgi:putative ABC transport system permease protein
VRALDRKLLRDLWRIRGQAATISLVIACAIATAVMSFSVLRSLAETRSEYYARYRFADVFASLRRAPESLAETISKIPGVARVQTRLVTEAALEIEGLDEPVAGRVLSLPERGAPALNAIVIRRGSAIAPEHPDDVLVSERFATANGLAPGSRLQALLGGQKRELTIVGIALSPEYIYTLGPGQIAPDDRRFGVLWMGRQALARALGFEDAFNEVSLQLDRSRSAQDVIADLESVLKPYGGAGAYARAHQPSHAFVSSMLDQLAGVGRIVPAIFLVVAAFLAHTVLGRLIDTQRQDIGLLKALGVSDRAIGWHYLQLVLVLVAGGIALGLAAGAALGYGLTELYTEFFHFPFLHYRQDPAVSAVASAVCAAAMAGGAFRGVRRAASLPAVVAMAPAVPAVYRRAAWEKLGVHRRSSEATRMIARHLARWPLRAGLAIGGLAAAVALQISMLFSFDALDHMINGFYARAQHQDLTVFFAAAPPSAAVDEVARWPGVRKVEGFRAVPVQLSFAGRERVVTLTGLQSTATLTHLLDAKLAPVAVPSQGVALSSKLAEVLQAKTGDRVTVQPIGARNSADVPVTRLTEQYIGMDAYMDFDALNALLGEHARISGVHLLIDERQRGALYRTLKETPGVAGISERQVVLEAFRQTMARTLTIIVSFFVAFAALTAFGIVYSNARILFSERERELATLAALGFGARELGYILVGELAILVLLALPLGTVLGRGLAWVIVQRLDTELYRVPLVIYPSTVGLAIAVVLAAAAVSTWIVARNLARLDLLGVLSARQ